MLPDHAEEVVWVAFADVVLQRLVALHQVGRGQPVPYLGDDGSADVDTVAARLQPRLDEARAALHSSLDDDSSALGTIAANARLTVPEREVLAVALACELDVRRQQVLAYIQDDAARTRLSLQTVGWLLGGLEHVPAAVGIDARLRRAALVEVHDSGSWAQHTVVVPPAVVWALLGDDVLDPDLPYGVTLVDTDDVRGDELVIVTGPDRVRRREAAVAATVGSSFISTSAPTHDGGWAAVVREATLRGCGVVVEVPGTLDEAGRRWVERADHLPWAISSPSDLPIAEMPDRPFRDVEVTSSPVTDLEWAEAFGHDTPRAHRLSAQQVEQVRRVYAAHDHDLDRAVRRLLTGPMGDQAQRIRPRHTWDDLVLGDTGLGQLREIVDRYRYAVQVYDRWGFSATPSRGLVALFAGKSGTGKTLAAEVVAGELGLDMFKLDLSSVVSKYIGETEKNLDEVFDAASAGNVVLFFDEADALFGKRSEVKDAQDRYANLGVSYLLQRIEAFDGVVVLATNFEKSIDDAFLRRIHARVEFRLPESDDRLAIWRRHLPPTAPAEQVDLPWLAERFDLSGGQIRNAVVHAAFLAASEDGAITTARLVRGVAQEMRKAGRLLRASEFGEWYALVASTTPDGLVPPVATDPVATPPDLTPLT